MSTNIITVTAIDGCGNITNKTFTITVGRPVVDKLYINYLATNRFVIHWTNGILQVSTAKDLFTTNVDGTYIDVPGAFSPYTNVLTYPASFYRLRCN
jgi:hypothetical protein